MEKSFIVDSHKMEYIWNSFHNSTLLQMCRQMINTHLLNNGITFCKNGCRGKAISIDAEMEEMLDEKWIPFCSDAIDCILCFGFVVVSFQDKYPSVLKLGTYRIKVNVIDNQYEWHVMHTHDAEQEYENVEVFNHFGLEPRIDGELTSFVAKVIPRMLFLKSLRESCIDMEFRRANPMVFGEIKDQSSSNRTEGVDYDFYADAGATESRDDMQYSRNKSAVAMLNKQKELYEQYMGRKAAVKAQATLDSVIQLPSGQHVVNAQMTSGRSDLVNLHKIIQEEVCSVIGVPRSMMFADSGIHRGDSEGIHDSFMHTLLWYKKKLGVMLSDIYNTLFTDKIMKDVDFSKEKNAYEAKKKHKVQAFFPITPFVPNTELRILYEQGVISWDSYATYALRNVSLPIEDKLKAAPPKDELLFEKPEPKEAKIPGKPAGKPEPDETPDKSDKGSKKRKKDDKEDKKETKKVKVAKNDD